MANGGEVFVLDMGVPVVIDSLARSMIQLAGLKVRDAAHPDGDITIEYIGLRPGEKLRDELLIGSDAKGTAHPRIQTSNEPHPTSDVLERDLAALGAAMARGDISDIHEGLRRAVEGYHPGGASPPLAESDSLGYAWRNAPSKALH